MKNTRRVLMGMLLAVALVVSLVGTVAVAQEDSHPIVMASLVEVYTIDPAGGMDQAIGSSLKQLYDSLFRYVGNPPQVEPTPPTGQLPRTWVGSPSS